jgi:hypothetical protein
MYKKDDINKNKRGIRQEVGTSYKININARCERREINKTEKQCARSKGEAASVCEVLTTM